MTGSGFEPFVGLPVKSAMAATADMPVNEFVLPPPLLVVRTTTLLKLPAFKGLNRTIRLVEPNPGSVNGAPEMMRKGPPTTLAVPLLMGAPPKLVRTKLN